MWPIYMPLAPITKKVRSQHAPWITNNDKQGMHRRDFWEKKAVKTGPKQLYDVYKKTRNT